MSVQKYVLEMFSRAKRVRSSSPPLLTSTTASAKPTENESASSILNETTDSEMESEEIVVDPVSNDVRNKPTTDSPLCTPEVICDPHDIGLFVGANVSKHDPATAFHVLTNPWKPSSSYLFPRISSQGKLRSTCLHQWLETHQWLSYSKKLNGVFCRFCVSFPYLNFTRCFFN